MNCGLSHCYSAGSQEWFRQYTCEARFRKSTERLADYGCGLVALTDLKDYLSDSAAQRKHSGRSAYLKKLLRLDRWSMHAFPGWGTGALQLIFHLKCCGTAGKYGLKISWYCGGKLLRKTAEMLRNDIPVILCAGPGLCTSAKRSDGSREVMRGILLTPAEAPERDDLRCATEEAGREAGLCGAEPRKAVCVDTHYMTVTDLFERNGRLFFGLYSWGSYWETDAEAFVRGIKRLPFWLRCFSGVLYIRKKQDQNRENK